MDKEEQIKSLMEVIEELQEEASIPKNVKDKFNSTISALKGSGDVSIRVNKALHELEEIADDPNLQPYTRTQIWNIVSMLEKLS
jgi:uncharacterized protein (UPF0147 family)